MISVEKEVRLSIYVCMFVYVCMYVSMYVCMYERIKVGAWLFSLSDQAQVVRSIIGIVSLILQVCRVLI
jgi:hypothetical protein